MECELIVKLVMPRLVPGIHVSAALKQERRGWSGRSPAMTKKQRGNAVRLEPCGHRIRGHDSTPLE
jgi:hypothetical protein